MVTALPPSLVPPSTPSSSYSENSHCNFLLQTTMISLLAGPFSFIIVTVYCQQKKKKKTTDQYKFLSLLSSLGPRFICGGDFNAKHPGYLANPRGSLLHNILNQRYFPIKTNLLAKSHIKDPICLKRDVCSNSC